MARTQTTAVQDRLVLDLDELKALLGIDPLDTSQDAKLTLLLSAALRAADMYLNNPFTADDGTELPIPDTVKAGVVAWVDSRRSTLATGRDPDVIREKVGQIEREYRAGGTTSATISATLSLAEQYWDVDRFEPL